MSLLRPLVRLGLLARAQRLTVGYTIVNTQRFTTGAVQCISPIQKTGPRYYVTPEEDLEELPKFHKIMPGGYLTEEDKLRNGIWPWKTGIRARLPEHYKQRYIETFTTEPVPVHYRADPRKYYKDENGQIIRVQNVPIPITYPKQADEGLWGGEGLIIGYKKKKDNHLKPRAPKMWKPRLWKRVFYSEILDKHMAIVVTPRTLDLVDEAYGFDFYILKTHEVDLKSKLGMTLKREMLLTLARRSLYPDNPERQEEIYNRYKQYIIPEEEAEWVGLSLEEAEKKQEDLEAARLAARRPFKEAFTESLVDDLKHDRLGIGVEGEEGWLSKLNPFKEDSKEKS